MLRLGHVLPCLDALCRARVEPAPVAHLVLCRCTHGLLTFGSAASLARLAIKALYSGVPFLGGTPSGSPPNHVGRISALVSPIVRPPVAQDISGKHAPKRISLRTNFITTATCTGLRSFGV